MTKEEKTRIEVRDEIEYLCSPVRHGGKQVGFSPRRRTKDLDEMLSILEPEEIWSLADRQLDQDGKNKVRAKFTKAAVSASAIIKAIAVGELDVLEVQEVEKIKGISFTKAAASLMGVGEDAKVEPNKTHWDILPAPTEEAEEETKEES